MDNLTHALSGALIARATAPRVPDGTTIPLRRRLVLGAVAASLPDLDFVISWFSPLAYLENHRGVTHSLLMLPLWSILFAWLCSKLWRRGPGWRAYFGVFAWGIGIHIAGDWITSFGTMLLAPVSDRRFELSTTFIIDLWLMAILIIGMAAMLVRRHSRWPAISALVAVMAYVGFQGWQRQEAIAFGSDYARAQNLADATVTAVPRPASPYNWLVVVEAGDRIDHAQVRLVQGRALFARIGVAFFNRIAAPYQHGSAVSWTRGQRFGPSEHVAVVRGAYESAALSFFRWFAMYPVFTRLDEGADNTCVWFEDLRFVTPGRDTPFRFGACRNPGERHAWAPFELVGDVRVPVR